MRAAQDEHGSADMRHCLRYWSVPALVSSLREPVGQQVGLLAAQYGIQISYELFRIVPDQNDWFFEQS